MRSNVIAPLLAATVLIGLYSAAPAGVVLNDPFTDGNLNFGSDPNNGNFLRQAGTAQTIEIVADAFIGSGNALAYNSPANGSLFIGQMQSDAVLGANVGDKINFGFDFRFTALPSSANASIFRFGIFDHVGAAPTDGGTETNPDSGYIENFGAGGSAGDAAWGKESGGSDGLGGGSGAAGIAGNSTLHAVDINDTLAHHVLSQITRTASGISLATFFDSVQVDGCSDSASPFTTFNEVAFRLTGVAAANYDNVLVETVPVPEPASVLLIVAILPLLRGRERTGAFARSR